MRMTIKSISVVICLGLLCFPALAAEMSVQVKQAQLRAKPGPLAKIEVTLAYGARVNVLEEQTDCYRLADGCPLQVNYGVFQGG